MKNRLNGEELKIIRTLRNARVVDVANVVGRSTSSICYVEAGDRSLDELQSEAVLTAFKIDEDLLQMIRRTIRLSKI